MKLDLLALGILLLSRAAAEAADDLAALGLRGPVSSYEQSLASYDASSGRLVDRGLTARAAFDGMGRYLRSESYHSGRLSQRGEWTYSASGALERTRRTQYDDDGGVSWVTETAWDASGATLEERRTDGRGLPVSRWVAEKTDGGSRIRYDGGGLSEETRFDDAQRMLGAYRSGGWPPVASWSYVYGASGRLERAEYSSNRSGFGGTWSYEYGAEGRLVGVRHARTDGTAAAHTGYEYDDAGRLVVESVTLYSLDGKATTELRTVRDSRGRATELICRELAPGVSAEWSHEYDQSDRIVESRQTDTFGRVFQQWRYAYDAREARVLDARFVAGIATGYRSENSHDPAGRLVGSTTYDLSGRVVTRTGCSYNAQGDLEETSTYNPDGSLETRWTYLYEYDEHGNWVSRASLYTDNAAEIYRATREESRRRIQYY